MLGTVRVFQLAKGLGYKIREILVLETMETEIEYMIRRQEEMLFIEATFIQKWLRETKELVLVIKPEFCEGIVCSYKWVLYKRQNSEKNYHTYEEALLEGVNETLKILRDESRR